MRYAFRSLLLAAALATAVACRTSTSDAPREAPGPVVATWGSGSITAADVRSELAKMPAPSRADPEQRRTLLGRMITDRLLVEEALRRGYGDEPEVVRALHALRDRLVVQRLMRDLRQRPVVSEDEARRYYEEHVALYSSTRVRASHILLEDEETAKAVYAVVSVDPERFAELAREKSTDQTSAKRGGDLGTFGVGRMVPEFERAAFALAVGEVSPPIHTQYGWHVIRVTERIDGKTRPFDAVKTEITSLLANQKTQERIETTVEQLRTTAGVHVDEAALAAIEPPAGAAPSPHGSIGGH